MMEYTDIKATLEDIQNGGPRRGLRHVTNALLGSFSFFAFGMIQLNVLKEKQSRCIVRWDLDVRNLLLVFISYQSSRTIYMTFLCFEVS